MKKSILYIAAVLLIYVSESQCGDIFSFSFETILSKEQIPPNFNGKWLFLGCDSIIPVNAGLKNSGDMDYPYKIKISRKLPKPDSACDKGENIIIRNIKGVLPGRFSVAIENSVNDSTKGYYTDKDTISIIRFLDNGGAALRFISGSQKQIVKNEAYESADVSFCGDINNDNHIDFVIRWLSNYSNKYELFISKADKGIWQLKKEAETAFSD